MYLLHNTDESYIYKILSDGKLKSSSKTKNVRMYGNPSGSKYIYLRIEQKKDLGNLYLDSKLLLENVFYLQIGWHGEIIEEKIDGRNMKEDELKILLEEFKRKVVNNYKKQKKIGIPIMMSNEILVKNNINLKKYLKKIKIVNKSDKIKNILKNNYPNVLLL